MESKERVWLRELREAKGMTRFQMAKAIGIDENQYRYVEVNGGFSKNGAMDKIANYFGFDVSRFGKKSPKQPTKHSSPETNKKLYDAMHDIYEDEMRIVKRIKKRGNMKEFKPMITFFENGNTSGNYWELVSSRQ